MSALAPWWKRVGFEDPFHVERNLTVGAMVGVGVALVVAAFVSAREPSVHPIVSATLCLLHLTLPRHNKWLMLGAVAVTLSLGVCFDLSVRTLPWLCAASLGLAMAFEQPSWGRRALVAFGPALGTAWALALAHVFSAKYLGSARVLTFGAIGLSGVFVALCSSLGTLTLSLDALEPRLRVLDPKVRETWQRLHRVARRFSPERRRQVLDLASMVASRWLDARLEQVEVSQALERSQFDEATAAIERLEQRLNEVSDSELRAHLEQSIRVHRDTLEQLDGLRRRAERAEARAVAEVSWLDTAVLTLELTPTTEERVLDATSRLASLASRHSRVQLAAA